MNLKKNITGIILAGGKSSRMGSEKGLLLLYNKTFIQHIIEAIRPLVAEIIIVSSNKKYDEFEIKRVEDIIPESGPIGGLHSGLTHSKTEDNIVVSCDVPLITTTILNQLLTYREDSYDIVQFEGEGKTIPLIALYKRHCAKPCYELLSKGEKRLRKLVSTLHTKTISVSEKELLFVKNINTIEDLYSITYATNH